MEVAAALLYLHSAQAQDIAHGCLRPSTILLDGALTVHLAFAGVPGLLSAEQVRHLALIAAMYVFMV